MAFEDNRDIHKEALRKATETGVLTAMLLVEGQAKMLATVDTGQLRDSIDHKVEARENEVEGRVGSGVIHAPFIEFGTGEFAENGDGRKGGWVYRDPKGDFHFTLGNKPQPFLRPSFRHNKQQIEILIGKEFIQTFGGEG